MIRSRALVTAAIAVPALALAAACSSSSPPASSPTTGSAPSVAASAAGNAATVVIAATQVSGSTAITGPGGYTLYRFDPDTATASNCTGSCASLWPPITGTPSAGSGVTAAQLGTITRPDGSKQVTYLGHPLYRYTGDSGPGQTNGDGVQGIWHVMKPGAAPLGGSAGSSSPSASPSKSSGGGGYGY